MIFRKQYMQNIINIVVMIICVGMLFIGSSIITNLENSKSNLQSSIETEWREQAKRTLSNIQNCFMYDMNRGLVDPKDEASLQEWAKRNLSGILNGGDTSDAFMINLEDEKFIWDGSLDCARPEFIINGRFLKDEAELHYDKEQAKFIIDKMRLSKSTIGTNNNYWWNFDGSPEYLEWTIIPPGNLGFDGATITTGGVKNEGYSKLLIALGTQQDEVRSTFDEQFKLIDKTIWQIKLVIVISIALCILNMSIYVYLNKRRVHIETK